MVSLSKVTEKLYAILILKYFFRIHMVFGANFAISACLAVKDQSLPVWEMFSGKEPAPLPSDESEEEDYYFMEDD